MDLENQTHVGCFVVYDIMVYNDRLLSLTDVSEWRLSLTSTLLYVVVSDNIDHLSHRIKVNNNNEW